MPNSYQPEGKYGREGNKGVRLLFVALFLVVCSFLACLGLPVTSLLIFVAMLSIVATGGRLSSTKT